MTQNEFSVFKAVERGDTAVSLTDTNDAQLALWDAENGDFTKCCDNRVLKEFVTQNKKMWSCKSKIWFTLQRGGV